MSAFLGNNPVLDPNPVYNPNIAQSLTINNNHHLYLALTLPFPFPCTFQTTNAALTTAAMVSAPRSAPARWNIWQYSNALPGQSNPSLVVLQTSPWVLH